MELHDQPATLIVRSCTSYSCAAPKLVIWAFIAGFAEQLESTSPAHGQKAAHPPAGPLPQLRYQPDFPIVLAFNRSDYVHTESWYYGVSHGMAFAQIFRPQDQIWLIQSPNGGGEGNPAWDFQWFITNYKKDQAYGLVMRAAYLPFENREQLEAITASHRRALPADR